KTRLKLSLRTNFRNLVKYLEELRKLPCLVTFEKALISKNQLWAVESDSLNIELEIAVYTLRQFLI
ncbi:MAG: hypothetical protein NC821_06385, partial [Candidatus Omnitrophica bacterium]|nr:hypothetical protein [Candidatus Omnitrophota bacterium]